MNRNFRNNHLSGTIPSTFDTKIVLTYLYPLISFFFKNSIDQLNDFKSDLSANQLSGTIPYGVVDLFSLKQLSEFFVFFKPFVSKKKKKKKKRFLNDNQLTGGVPTRIWGSEGVQL